MTKERNQPHGVLAVIVNSNDEILLLKRSPDKKYFPNKWAVVSAGPVSGETDMKKFTKVEVKNEIGVKVKIIKEGKSFITNIGGQDWIMHVFLVNLGSGNIRLNEEHTEYAWVNLRDLVNYDLIPGREKMFKDLVENE